MASGRYDFDHSCLACLLVVGGNPHRAASVTHALSTTGSPSPKVTIVAGAADALRVISREPVRAVLLEHRAAGAADEQTVLAAVKSAGGWPMFWLIEDDDVIEVPEAIAAGVSGVFYWDQVGPKLLSVIDRLAPGTWSDRASLPNSVLLRLTAGWYQPWPNRPDRTLRPACA
jgi:DNA-binding NtrC family response regulator